MIRNVMSILNEMCRMLGKWTKFCLGRFGEALIRKWHLCEGNGVKAIEVSHEKRKLFQVKGEVHEGQYG